MFSMGEASAGLDLAWLASLVVSSQHFFSQGIMTTMGRTAGKSLDRSRTVSTSSCSIGWRGFYSSVSMKELALGSAAGTPFFFGQQLRPAYRQASFYLILKMACVATDAEASSEIGGSSARRAEGCRDKSSLGGSS
mmetsp:Transcript_9/g.10  ORF Transcript_9/g.10 Transcript_9/m.10 type:complete len:136 (-) Transcript_9:305-712(-)